MSLDKVVIRGAEFTRIDERYLLQSEVERALGQFAEGADRRLGQLGELLEDMVMLSDRMLLVQSAGEVSSRSASGSDGLTEASWRQLMRDLRSELRRQLDGLESYLNDGSE